jgi:ankyrin repeat protein
MTLVPVQNAAARGDVREVTRLVDADPSIIAKQGASVLMHAARANRPGVVALLAGRGVPIDVPGEKGATPMLCAASMGFEVCVRVCVCACVCTMWWH